MDRKTKNTMSDSLKHFVSDSIQSLGQSPILKGVVPTVAGAGITLIESLEVGLRITSVSLACIIGFLTVYVKGKEALKIYKESKKNKK